MARKDEAISIETLERALESVEKKYARKSLSGRERRKADKELQKLGDLSEEQTRMLAHILETNGHHEVLLNNLIGHLVENEKQLSDITEKQVEAGRRSVENFRKMMRMQEEREKYPTKEARLLHFFDKSAEEKAEELADNIVLSAQREAERRRQKNPIKPEVTHDEYVLKTLLRRGVAAGDARAALELINEDPSQTKEILRELEYDRERGLRYQEELGELKRTVEDEQAEIQKAEKEIEETKREVEAEHQEEREVKGSLEELEKQVTKIATSGKPYDVAESELVHIFKEQGLQEDRARVAALDALADSKNIGNQLKGLGFTSAPKESAQKEPGVGSRAADAALGAGMGVGKVGWKASAATARGLKNMVGKGVGKVADMGIDESILLLFFFGTLIAHIALYIFTGGDPSLRMVSIYALVSVLLIAIPYMIVSGDRRYSRIISVAVFAALMYGIPQAAATFLTLTENIELWSRIIPGVIPIWPAFFMMKLSHENDTWALLWKLYLLGLALLLGFFVLSSAFAFNLNFLPPDLIPASNSGNPIRDFFTLFWDSIKGAGTGITRFYNQTLNPGAYYTGRVEQNTHGELGVVIENFRPIDPEVDNESVVIVHGAVYAKSFVEDMESVQILPTCYVEGRTRQEGFPTPIILEVVYGTASLFECEFPEPFERGTYRIIGSATFPFQTWSYITYTFVDDELVRNLARQGRDVRQELEIRSDPTAIYTSGPVKLGMGGTPQPIRVTPDKEPYVPPGTKIGITLDPTWGGGTLDYVEKIELKVPKPFYLIIDECDRCSDPELCISEPDPNEPDYTNYIFKNTPKKTPVTTFTSITCSLGIEDSGSASTLVSAADKVQRSFIGVAYYTYTVSDQTSVRVR